MLIGNSGNKNHLNGQAIKVKLYKDLLTKEKVEFAFVDLNRFSRHPLSTMLKIAKKIKRYDRIVLLTAQRGVKVLIPFINFCNRKIKKPFVLPMIGVNILHKYIDSLSDDDHYAFMHNLDFKNTRPKKRDIKNLKKITYILPENELIKRVVTNFFGLNNVEVLQNFRDYDLLEKQVAKESKYINLVFLSRIAKEKGIFELIDNVSDINKSTSIVKLDIYGEKYLDKSELTIFDSKLNQDIRYLGALENDRVVDKLSFYDILVFPTLYKGEGTPGIIAESFILGGPVS